jgi:hypothetical protein
MGLRDLFRPKWQHSNPTKRNRAIHKIKDAGKLRQIYYLTDNWWAKETIAIKLHSEDLVSELAIHWNEPSNDLRDAVRKYVQDRQLLVSIARQALRLDLRVIAAIKLQDTELLIDILGETTSLVRKAPECMHIAIDAFRSIPTRKIDRTLLALMVRAHDQFSSADPKSSHWCRYRITIRQRASEAGWELIDKPGAPCVRCSGVPIHSEVGYGCAFCIDGVVPGPTVFRKGFEEVLVEAPSMFPIRKQPLTGWRE